MEHTIWIHLHCHFYHGCLKWLWKCKSDDWADLCRHACWKWEAVLPKWNIIFCYLLLVVSLVRSVRWGVRGPAVQSPADSGQTSLPLTLHLHTDWLRVRWPLFPHGGRAIRTCTSFRVTCLLWECRPMIGCAGACGCGLPCGCNEGGEQEEEGGQQSE